MDKEVARRELAGDIDAFGVHNIDNLAEFLIDRGWSLYKHPDQLQELLQLEEGAPNIQELLPVNLLTINLKLDEKGREEWLPTHPNKVLLRRSRRKYNSLRHYDLPTYVIVRITSKEYLVFGAGMGKHGMPMKASLTKIRGITDRTGFEHAVDNTEDYKTWIKV